jgi:hypothetical protein
MSRLNINKCHSCQTAGNSKLYTVLNSLIFPTHTQPRISFEHAIQEEAHAATFNLLPAKSKERYLNVLERFRDWMRTKNVDVITEEVILAYFNGLMGKLAPPSLWSMYEYSMLKSTLFVYEKVDISK